MKKFFMLLVSAIFVSGGIVSAQQVQVLELFHGEECPHCHKEKAWLPELKEKFPNLEIREYEVWHNEENKAIFNERLKELGETPQGVPTNVIGNQVIVGFQADKIIAALSGETTPVPTLYDTPPTGEEGAESGEEGAEADSANDKFVIFAVIILLLVLAGAFFARKND